jgi:hypothetical protein
MASVPTNESPLHARKLRLPTQRAPEPDIETYIGSVTSTRCDPPGDSAQGLSNARRAAWCGEAFTSSPFRIKIAYEAQLLPEMRNFKRKEIRNEN